MPSDQSILKGGRPSKIWNIGKILKRVMTILGVLYLFFAVVLHFAFTRGLEPVTEIGRYQDMKASQGEMAHFPDQIPATARDAKFRYQPGFLQGATTVRLQFTLPAAEIEALEKSLRATHQPLSAQDNEIVCLAGFPSDWQPAGRQTVRKEFTSFLLFPDLEAARRNWNHPKNGGISISASRNQVLYWFN